MSLNHSLGVLGFFSNIFVLLFLSILVDFDPYSTWSDLIAICTYWLLRYLLSDRYSNLFKRKIIFFSIISRMPIYIILLSSMTMVFYIFVLQHKPYHWKVLPFGLAMAPKVFTSITKPILSLHCHKHFQVTIYLVVILVPTCS